MLPWSNKAVRKRVAVIGDIILDEYLDGSVSRISPEAPVPIHLVKSTSHSAGGAANAARNISLAGGQAFLFGACGHDEGADILLALLKKDRVDTKAVICVDDRPTSRKTRVTASNQQIIRIDWEKIQPLEHENQTVLLDNLKKGEFDAILISDYGKGLLPRELLDEIFQFAQRRKIPSIVDPKGTDFGRYRGCDVITPNLKESYQALGLDEEHGLTGLQLGKDLQQRYGLNDVLVTMGAQGMIFVPAAKGAPAIYRKAQAKEVYDVSGAGDTVAAILALAMASKSNMDEALTIATLAAGIVVGKWGTQAITEEELERASLSPGDVSVPREDLSHKLVRSEDLPAFVAKLKKTALRVVFTNGCFDILHAGHVDYLQKARLLGDVLVVGVNSDESIRSIKGEKRPIVPLAQRLQVLAALSCVDHLVPFSDDTPLALIQSVSPDILVKGADYSEDAIVGALHVKGQGGVVRTIDLVPGLSTSNLIQRIREDA